jgi:hypothetical protein
MTNLSVLTTRTVGGLRTERGERGNLGGSSQAKTLRRVAERKTVGSAGKPAWKRAKCGDPPGLTIRGGECGAERSMNGSRRGNEAVNRPLKGKRLASSA